jgi:hypothetical protein
VAALLVGVCACGVWYNLSLITRMARLRPQTFAHAAPVRGAAGVHARRAQSPAPSPPLSPPPSQAGSAGTGCAATEHGVEYWGEVVGEWGYTRLTAVCGLSCDRFASD